MLRQWIASSTGITSPIERAKQLANSMMRLSTAERSDAMRSCPTSMLSRSTLRRVGFWGLDVCVNTFIRSAGLVCAKTSWGSFPGVSMRGASSRVYTVSTQADGVGMGCDVGTSLVGDVRLSPSKGACMFRRSYAVRC